MSAEDKARALLARIDAMDEIQSDDIQRCEHAIAELLSELKKAKAYDAANAEDAINAASERDAARARVADLEAEVARLEQDKAGLSRTVTELEEELAQALNEAIAARQKASDLNAEITRLYVRLTGGIDVE